MIQHLWSFSSREISYFFPQGIHADTVVSKHSKFGDDDWVFYDAANPRLLKYCRGELTINWPKAANETHWSIPQATIAVIKLFAFLYLYAPQAVAPLRKGNAMCHPRTVCAASGRLLQFLSHLHEKSRLDGGTLPPANSLAQVSVRHLRESLADWNVGRGSDLKRALTYLASQVIKNVCPEIAPTWTTGDISSLTFRESQSRDDYERVFPNQLFRMISNTASDDVAGFLRFVGLASASKQNGVIPDRFDTLKSLGPVLFAKYVESRAHNDEKSLDGRISGVGYSTTLYHLRQLGCPASELFEYIRRVHEASCALVALYTGGRYSDLTGFKVGCLRQIRGSWYLVGTHIKHQDLDKPTDQDLWPAIPAIRDALHCLELFTQFTKNEYLISSLNSTTKSEARPYSPNGLTNAMQRYIERIDVSGAWKDVTVSPHRCRHTLAHQLARADVGLPFIAHQLKHLYSALSAVPPQVTLMYGGIADLKAERAMQSPKLHYEMAKSLYDPESPIAGGGAEEFSHRRKQYFEGKMAAGLNKEDIILQLAGKAIPFSSVGMGYCLGRRTIKNKDGSIQKPPCIGSLQCAPDMCRNAIVTSNHEHLWSKVEQQNRALAKRPELQHAREALLASADRAKVILMKLASA